MDKKQRDVEFRTTRGINHVQLQEKEEQLQRAHELYSKLRNYMINNPDSSPEWSEAIDDLVKLSVIVTTALKAQK